MPRKRGPTLGAAQPCKQCSTKWRRLPGEAGRPPSRAAHVVTCRLRMAAPT